MIPQKLWTINEIAEYLGVKRTKAYAIVAQPWFPRACRPSPRVVRWIPSEVEKAVQGRKG